MSPTTLLQVSCTTPPWPTPPPRPSRPLSPSGGGPTRWMAASRRLAALVGGEGVRGAARKAPREATLADMPQQAGAAECCTTSHAQNTLADGPPACSTLAGSCVPGEAYPLWEIPLWAVADASQQAIAAMDPAGDAYENYKREVSASPSRRPAGAQRLRYAGAGGAPALTLCPSAVPPWPRDG